MNEYRITLKNGEKKTYHADTMSAAMKKCELWDETDDALKIEKIKRMPQFGPSREGSKRF